MAGKNVAKAKGGEYVGRRQREIEDLELTVENRDARIKALEDELKNVLEWALVEKAPLRSQEIESIRSVLGGK